MSMTFGEAQRQMVNVETATQVEHIVKVTEANMSRGHWISWIRTHLDGHCAAYIWATEHKSESKGLFDK